MQYGDPGDPLLAVIDRQLEIERKARAWDLAVVVFGNDFTGRAILAECLAEASARPPARDQDLGKG